VMFDAEAGSRLDEPFAEAKVGVVKVDRVTAITAHDVVVVRTRRPLEATPSFTPVDSIDLALAL